jgi:hypothetical protein
MEVRFTAGPRGPVIETPSCPALGLLLSLNGNSLDSWFLTTLEVGLQAVRSGAEPSYTVGSEDNAITIEPDRVEVDWCDGPPVTLPIDDFADVLTRWRTHLASLNR